MAEKFSKVDKKAKEDIVIGIIFILLSIVIYAATYQLPVPRIATSGPAFWPRLLVIMMSVMALFMIANAIIMVRAKQIIVDAGEIEATEKPAKDEPVKDKLRNWWEKFGKPVIAIGGTFVFYFLFPILGFIISVTALAALVALLVERELKPKMVVKILIQSFILAVGMYYLFGEFLSVRLPKGIF